MPDFFRPFQGLFAAVEALPGDGFADVDGEVLAAFFECFVRQAQHFEVGFQADSFTEIGEVVKEVRVLAGDEEGYDVPVVLYGFGDEALLPLRVADDAFGFAAYQSCGEHDHLAVGGIGLFDGGDRFFCHAAVFVDGEEDVVQVLQVEEQVVYREFQFGVMFAEEGDEDDPVGASQRVVGGEDVAASRGGEVFRAHHVVCHLQVFHHAVGKVQPPSVAVACDEFIDAVLVDEAFQE